MNINVYLREHLIDISDNLYVAPNIPTEKLNNAVASFEYSESPDNIVALYDDTLLRSGKDGLMITGEKIIYHPSFSDAVVIRFEDIENITYHEGVVNVNGNKKSNCLKILKKDKLSVWIKKIRGEESAFKKFQEVLAKVVSDNFEYKEEKQFMPIEGMSEDLKIAYIKVIINMTYDDGEVDSKELAEILMLMTRLKFNSDSKLNLRAYIASPDSIVSTDDLLVEIDEYCPEGQERSVHFSLVKDLMNVYLCANYFNKSISEFNFKEFEFLQKYRESLKVKDEEIDFALKTIKNDRKLLCEDVSDNEIVEAIQGIGVQATAVGLPIAAVYLSGSVVGLSAAGISSGLATIGMGGVLGLSGMVSGIGVAVLIGVGVYAGARKLTGLGKVSKSNRRENMLMQTITLTQQAISELMEDVNFVTHKLNELLQSDDVKSKKIRELGRLLEKLVGAGSELDSRKNLAQASVYKIRCPKFLNEEKLKNLTKNPTEQDICNFIRAHYEAAIETLNEGDEMMSTVKMTLKPDLTSLQLRDLADAFEAIGYNEVGNSLISEATSTKNKLMGFVKK